MRRFLMLVGVAAVAAAMYVAAASGSQQSKGPTLRQFNALKKQGATLTKNLKSVKTEADAVATIVGSCYVSGSSLEILPVSVLGSNTESYLFCTDSGYAAPTTALDVVGASPQYGLQIVDTACVSGTLKHAAVHSAVIRLRGSVPVH